MDLAPNTREKTNTLRADARVDETVIVSMPSALPAPVDWPEPVDEAALYGLAGDVVRAAVWHSEADPIAILAHTLAVVSAAVGPGPHALVGATKHSARVNFGIIGRTSHARKGDSAQPALVIAGMAGLGLRIQGGLSTGEGLIAAVRDPVIKPNDKGDPVVVDEGIEDKRLLVLEPEFARVLKVMSRQGNTLGPVLRTAYDSSDLRIMTKVETTATGAQIVVMAHVTLAELRAELPDLELVNGGANRFVFLAVRRVKHLPDPTPFAGPIVEKLANRLKKTVEAAKAIGFMQRDPQATLMWKYIYAELSADREAGLVDGVLARAEAHVLRLSMIYALTDGSAVVRVQHLKAALALWNYAERSAEYIWGELSGDRVLDAIASALRRSDRPLTSTDIQDIFSRHESASRIQRVLEQLRSQGKVEMVRVATGGRPREAWTWISG